MSAEPSTADAPTLSDRPSAVRFLLVSVLVAVAITTVSGWLLYERACTRADRLALVAAMERRLALSETLRALAGTETAGPISPDARAAARIALAALDRPLADQASQRAAGTLHALVDRRLATAGDQEARGLSAAIARTGAALERREAERAAVLARSVEARQAAIGLTIRLLSILVMAVALTSLWLAWRSRVRHDGLGREAVALADRLRAVFAGTSDAILILGPDLRVEEANRAAALLFDRSADELCGLPLSALVEPGDPGWDAAALWSGRYRGECVAKRHGGGTVAADVAFGATSAAAGRRLIASLRDVSERHAAERTKDDFISTISHELRTPLTSVVGALGLLREGAAGQLPDAAARLIDIADNNSRRLIRLVNDILDIDRLGSGRVALDLAPVDLADIAARAVRAAEGLAQPRSVALHLDLPSGPLMVTGDADRLMQVIGNLLSNAIRFSPARGEVLLAVETRGREAAVRVDDHGPGVPREFRDQLFGRFTQSSAGAAIPGGTGLGLAISREIVRAHAGDIWYADRNGGGAQFCFTVPLVEPTVADTRRRLLLCEDDAGIAALMRESIEDEGYVVDRCGSAAEALAMVRTGRYDVLLLDLSLPDADGLDAVRGVREQPESADLPVIVVSGSAEYRQMDPSADGLGVAAWLNKPVNHRRLLRALDAAIAHADSGRPVLLHVEDDGDVRAVVALALADRGRVLQAGSLASARAALAGCTPAAAILDLDLPDGSGLDLLPDLAAGAHGRVPAVIYSAAGDLPRVGDGVDAVLAKSARSLLALSDTVGSVMARERMMEDSR